ncbi:MAG: epoxyqueuosine reductase [Chloroflexota bacterium]|nr:MAG: epoxyqueuosine reductase [Chloroflexota bacterium]
MIDSGAIKKRAIHYGADICGIAPVARFVDAPTGFHPCDIYPDCRSVVVYAARFPLSTLKARTNAPYTLVRSKMVDKVDWISFHVSSELESESLVSIPIPSADPYDYWDADRTHGRGILSLKHAGVLAGLGVLGKNTLLMNERFGNMIWLGAILVSVDLEPDPMASYEGCSSECTLCMDSCPQHALDGITIDQRLCRQRSISYNYGGGSVLSCNICRKVCPYRRSLPKKM